MTIPNTTINIIGDDPIAEVAPRNTLLIGQVTDAGSVHGTLAAGESVFLENVEYGTEAALFGANSVLYNMFMAFRSVNPYSQVDAFAIVDETASDAATYTVTFTASTPAAGTLTIRVGGESYALTTTTTSTATTIAAALVTAITADTDAVVSAANTDGVVTLTADNAGTVGNDIPISVSGTISGVTTAIATAVAGATDPTLDVDATAGTIEGITIDRSDIVTSLTGTFTDLVSLQEGRFNIDNEVKDGCVYFGVVDDASTISSAYLSQNDKSYSVFADKPITASGRLVGGAYQQLMYKVASEFQGIATLRQTDGKSIADYVATNNPTDQFGGVYTNSLPYANTPITATPAANQDKWTQTEIDTLKAAGVTPLVNNNANNGVVLGEVVTGYKTNAQGLTDNSFKYLNYLHTSSAAREYIYNQIKNDYAQKRLTTGRALAGTGVASELSIRASMSSYFDTLASADYLLLRSDAKATFMDNLTVSIDASTGTVTIYMILPIMTQVRTINITAQINFSA